jgi:hypothetical protein
MFQIIFHECISLVISSPIIFINSKWHQYLSTNFDLRHKNRGFDLMSPERAAQGRHAFSP